MKKLLLPLCLFVFLLQANAQIVINEINYKDSVDFQTKDWVELYNNGNSSVDISNWVFKDDDDLHEFIIPNGTVMTPGSFLVLVQFLADFQALFPDAGPVLGDFEFGLSGGGELIRLFDDNGTLMDFVEYDDIEPWPTEPDGNGPTLELRSPNLDNELASSWAASVAPFGVHGTPGGENSTYILGTNSFDALTVSIFPNPLVNQTTIKVSNANTPLQVSIYNLLGKEVRTMSADSGTFTIKRDNLVSGIYILKIATENGLVQQSKKLIVK